MTSHLNHQIEMEAMKGGGAYVRNLAAAEAAVLRGQFNVAKVLRAMAHSQRVQAIQTARHLASDLDPADLFRAIFAENVNGSDDRRAVIVRERNRQLLNRALASLEQHGEVKEDAVALSLWGCYNCGNIAEGDRPDACDVCGALGVEFEWFGPFYAMTSEHLGQLTPNEILQTLEAIPAQVAQTISSVDDATLARKPSATEWSAKEIIGHMLETDLLFAQRVKTILAEQSVRSIDSATPPWKLHEGKGYEKMSADEILKRLRDVRAASLALVRGLSPQDWARRGTLRGAGATVLDLGTWVANHDRGHLAQVHELYGRKGRSVYA